MREERGVKGVRQGQLEHLLTAKEVANFMNVHVSSVGRWSRAGRLKFYRVGYRGDMRFTMKDVIRFLKESKLHRASTHPRHLHN